MPQNIDFDTPSRPAPRTSVTGTQSITVANDSDDGPRLRQPTNSPRSVNLNDEVPLNEDGVTPEVDEPELLKESKTNEIPEDQVEETETEDKDGEEKKSDEVKFVEDEDTEEQAVQPKEDTVNEDEVPAGPRDYKTFPEQKLVPLLKKLPNSTYKAFEPVLRELVTKASETEKLSKQLAERPKAPSYQYENPESYLLDPEYRKIEQTVSIGQQEVNHWQQQLLRIERGEPWQNITGFDQNGSPIYQTIRAPEDGVIDIQSRLAIQNHLNSSLYPTVGAARQQLGNFQSNYKRLAGEAETQLKQIVTKIFPTVPDVTKLEGEDKEWYDMSMSAFPQVFDGHPIIREVVGRMAVVMRRTRTQVLKLRAENKRLKGGIDDQRVAGAAKIPQGGGSRKSGTSGGKVFKYKDGRAIKADDVVPLGSEDES